MKAVRKIEDIYMKNRHMVHRVPSDTAPAQYFKFELSGVQSSMKSFDEGKIGPRKNQKNRKKERFTEVNMTFSYPVKIDQMRWTMDGKSIEIIGAPSSLLLLPQSSIIPQDVEVITYYSRENSRKVIGAFYFRNEIPPSTIHRALERFDYFYAIDTNTVNFSGFGAVSVTTAMRGTSSDIGNGYGNFSAEIIYQDIGKDILGNPEVSAWYNLILRLLQYQDLVGKRIGIIVDSDLGKIKDINYRNSPLIDDFFLPANYELVFATDAAGIEEYFTNRLIRECDKSSKLALEEFEMRNGLSRTKVK
ncbi:hypothetical protein GTP81_13985 [Rugamonas sp. FT107W]|uniref:Uncharacterized protein n=1 Tax=Duganella vulcania TaxID=2692166 RepID=A0A845HMW4_9BURK|nr:hypothetical protein [Duganella vulcania]MYN17866.1 hypothetical protein [Duganella vulcania]